MTPWWRGLGEKGRGGEGERELKETKAVLDLQSTVTEGNAGREEGKDALRIKAFRRGGFLGGPKKEKGNNEGKKGTWVSSKRSSGRARVA